MKIYQQSYNILLHLSVITQFTSSVVVVVVVLRLLDADGVCSSSVRI